MGQILVLGGGRQGRVIAQDLATTHPVLVADARELEKIPKVATVRADVSKRSELLALMKDATLVVGALPAALGFEAARAAIAAGRSYVDIAFYEEDAERLDAEAKAAKVAVLPDCGLAPGLSHLLVGRALAANPKRPKKIEIQVGGVAADPTRPYGYVVTWSPADLLEEYRRPARIIRDGRVVSVPALSGLERVEIPGVGAMEAFFTDGLRTLLGLQGIPLVLERTLRWPGHVQAIQPLLAKGDLVSELTEKCAAGDDLVVLRVIIDDVEARLVARAQDGLSAMARTTALTCAAFARLVARGGLREVGVVPPEVVGRDAMATRTILDELQARGIAFTPPRPFC